MAWVVCTVRDSSSSQQPPYGLTGSFLLCQEYPRLPYLGLRWLQKAVRPDLFYITQPMWPLAVCLEGNRERPPFLVLTGLFLLRDRVGRCSEKSPTLKSLPVRKGTGRQARSHCCPGPSTLTPGFLLSTHPNPTSQIHFTLGFGLQALDCFSNCGKILISWSWPF